MKTVDVNKSFFENLVPTKRKVRRRGLQIAQQGLARQKKLLHRHDGLRLIKKL
jgi:hypothetical protein